MPALMIFSDSSDVDAATSFIIIIIMGFVDDVDICCHVHGATNVIIKTKLLNGAE